MSQRFNILIVAQAGRLEYQAVLFAASLRQNATDFSGRLIVAEPANDGAWTGHQTRISDPVRSALTELGAKVTPFVAEHFGASYPYGNKIEALALLPQDEPFLFVDTDTLVTGPLDRVAFDFDKPAASMRREATWPDPPLYGPGYTDIWRSLYDRFGLEFKSSLDLSQPDEHWERYLYFNAGWFFGSDPAEFAARFLAWSVEVRDAPGEALAAQSLDPWLDQVVLPLVIHSLAGGRPGPQLPPLDNGAALWHYRNLSLLYAEAPESVVAALERAVADPRAAILADWSQVQQMVLDGQGRAKVRPLFDRARLPSRQQAIRQKLKSEGLWLT
ncbi:MAG: hypothetical protein DI498_06250 [Paracoccus denitrificans]|nr:MAG: hypothetical protein DI498_06250 [Paracoccus denitrificans]PZO84805.1 MAG: hypothetical protein DI633_06250 [Paracoccus denitrificans]